MHDLEYYPQIFDCKDHQSAKEIILTFEDISTDVRWETETPYLTDLISEKVKLDENSNVLDFGTGIGRMCKPLIHKFNCFCVGSDISHYMRALSIPYVGSDKFIPVSNHALSKLNMQFDLAMAIWVFQHSITPKEDINLVVDLLKPGGTLFVLNNIQRVIPCISVETQDFGWVKDNQSIMDLLQYHPKLKRKEIGKIDAEKVRSKTLSDFTFYAFYEKQ